MSKKAGRSARAIQAEAQRMGINKATRPLVDVEKSSLAGTASTTLSEVADFEAAPIAESKPAGGSTTLPRRVYARRTSTIQPAKNNSMSREEEYAFIRADLRTVFILTVLMTVLLIVLTFVVR